MGPGYQLYLGLDEPNLIILLCGGTKHRRQDDIAEAQAHWAKYKRRKMEGGDALPCSFKNTVKVHAERVAASRDALLTEAVEQFLACELDTGKAVLRDYINAPIAFDQPAQDTDPSSTSLMRMLSPAGNPTAGNLFAVLLSVQRTLNVHAAVASNHKLRHHFCQDFTK